MLTRDGLPAETTWLWDPVSDRLVAVMRAGASFNASDPNGNVVRQFIHGDMGYDDPLEVTAFNASTSKVDHLYPIFNEAAGGELQAVINGNGELVARSINTDPYGSAEFDINGAAVDQVSISAKKTSAGAVDSVTIRMRSTEQISASTVTTGARLAVVDGAGTVLRTSATAPALDTNDPFTIVWTVPASEWTSLTDGAPVTVNGTSHTPSALSIAATSTLRAAVWSASVPFQPPPDWAKATKPVTSSAALPFEDRESLTSATSFVTSLASGATDTCTVYDIPSLSLIGTTTTSPWIRSLFASTFQAHPFAEPMNGKNYARHRWYDPQTGSFLTPDPLGYTDSSNLYTFAGGDPVNGRDPEGLARRTKNGGINHLGDISANWKGDTWWSRATGVAVDTLGNTLSDALMLDTWADANVVAWDSSRSGKERAIAAAKGVGVAAVNLAGGEILGTAGKVLLKVPGAKNVAAKVASSAAGRLLATDVKVLANRAGAAVAKRVATREAENVAASIGAETISASARGNPQAIARGLGDLSGRQSDVLAKLTNADDSTIVPKRMFGQNDLAALTAATGDEFAMFTTGGRRLVMRGSPTGVPIGVPEGESLAPQGWRWSAHTHPGVTPSVLPSSVGDRAVLGAFGNVRSAIFNSTGERSLFKETGDLLTGWLPR